MARLEITLLGGFAARLGRRPLRLPGTKPRALLAYLALGPGRALPRERLAALLWHEADEKGARDSLRHALAVLRTTLGAGRASVLVADRESVALRPGATVDAARFQALVARGTSATLEQAARLYAGDLLEGVDVDEEPFREWLLAERARLRELAVVSLSRLLAHHIRRGAAERAVQTAERLLALDPAHEVAHRALMRLHAAAGRRGLALRQYRLCVDVLARDLGTEPEPETKALYQELLQPPPGPAAPPPAPPGRTTRAPVPPPREALIGESALLVGRDAEAAELRKVVAAAARGQGRVVVLAGEAGVGKTRLAAVLAQHAVAHRVCLLTGRSYESEGILPFGPWVTAVRAGGVGVMTRSVARLGRPWRAELARLFPEFGRSTPPPPATRDPLRLFEAVARFVECLAEDRPVAIILEDLHWADDASARLFAFLGRRLAALPAILLGTVRSEDAATRPLVGQVLEEIRREPSGVVLTLEPLGHEDTRSLVRALARPATEPACLDRLAERVWRLSEGNPFVVTEAMRTLRNEDVTNEAGPLSPPARVRDLVGARLDRLGERALTLARIAAVRGAEVDFGLLCRASRLEDAHVAAAVEELVRARVLKDAGDQLIFVHERVRDVVLAGTPSAQRILLHRRVAEGLESVHGLAPETHVGALARHYRDGKVWPKAVEYLAQLAELATRRYAVDDAVTALSQAQDLVRRLPPSEQDRRGLDLALRLAHALYFLGRHDEGRRLLLAEEDRLARAKDPSIAARYHFLLARSASLTGDDGETDRRARMALADAERAGDVATMGQAHYLLAHEAYWTGRCRVGVQHAEHAIAHLEQAGERWWLGHAWWILCVNFGFLGRFGPALEAARRTDAIGEALEDQRLRSYAAWSAGWIRAACGDPDGGAEACRRALGLAPDPVSRMNARQALGYCSLEAGRCDQAIQELEPVVAELARLGVWRPHGLFSACLAEAQRVAGRHQEALALAEDTVYGMRTLGYAYAFGLAQRTLGRLALDAERPLDALERLRDACETFAASGAEFEEARTRLDLGAALSALGRGIETARELDLAHRTFRALDVPRYVERTRRLVADLAREGTAPST